MTLTPTPTPHRNNQHSQICKITPIKSSQLPSKNSIFPATDIINPQSLKSNRQIILKLGISLQQQPQQQPQQQA